MGWTPRTLKGQLTLLFLVVTLVPSLLLTALATSRLLAALEQWENPGVQRALEGSLEVARDLMDRTRNDLRQRGQLLAADPLFHPPIDSTAAQDRLATAYNLDFVQLYDEDGALRFEVVRDPLLSPPGRLGGVRVLSRSERPFVEDAERGLLAFVGLGGEPGEPGWILTAGIYLDPDFYQRLDDLSSGVLYYRRLGQVKRVNRNAVLIALGLVVVGLALGSSWIARRLAARVSGPVSNLARGMGRVARGEDAVRVDPSGSAEVEGLIRTFNAMSAELTRSRGELARAERLTAWREAARRVAHEIKNALTPITFSLHRLKKTAADGAGADPGRAAAALDTLVEEVEGLRRLAASFSELARLPVPEMAPVDLAELVRATVESVDQGERVSWSAPSEPDVVPGDRTLLRQALTNLIKNALDAAGPQGHVWVRLEPAAERARLVVEDDGPGWPAGARESVLEPYFTTKSEGTGLGLSLVQRTILQHGGSLDLDDRPGGGARVTLSLPRRARIDSGPTTEETP